MSIIYTITRYPKDGDAERVRQLTGITLDLESYDYFLDPSFD